MLLHDHIISQPKFIVSYKACFIVVVNNFPAMPVLHQDARIHLLIRAHISVKDAGIFVVVFDWANAARSDLCDVSKLVFGGGGPADVGGRGGVVGAGGW